MSIPPGPWRFKLAATVIPAAPPPTIKTLWCVVPAIMALPSNWPARCGLGHSLAKHRIIILNPMSIAVQHAHEGRRFFAPAPPPRQNVACEGVGLIRLCFRGMLCRGLASWSDFVSGGTESSRTRRWREMDSNPRSPVAGRGQAARNQIFRRTTGTEEYVRRNKAADRLVRRAPDQPSRNPPPPFLFRHRPARRGAWHGADDLRWQRS